MVLLHVGIDDTDSKKGMCTTYLMAVLLDKIESIGRIQIIGYPRLVRLNPNCPFKTRGNAALAFDAEVPEEMLDMLKNLVLDTVRQYADLKEKNTDPGVAFLANNIPRELNELYERALVEIISMDDAISLAKKLNIEIHRFGYGRGIIGAMAAIGCNFRKGYTYEFIAYRTKDNIGKPRGMDKESVVEMDRLTFPYTFDNIDYSTDEIRIMPHTPCPVYFGIRGTDPSQLNRAFQILRPLEPVERYRVYKTNQGTDAHIKEVRIADAKENMSVSIKGRVTGTPKIIAGGHVIFSIADDTGQIDCAAYEPTKDFRSIILNLSDGDIVEVYGGVKKKQKLPLTVNLEKIKVISVAKKMVKVAPSCPRCGRRMKSEGRNKGYQCPKCKFKDVYAMPSFIPKERRIQEGLYTVPPRARRHLSKPAQLYYLL
ncbi:MAG: tRNA(Ile)(2)-agmatinylcytidine synthase [Conexivisphaerales archaeon]